MVGDMSPFLKWTLAVIAGGGAAGVVQGTTVLARSASTATTGGLGNPLVATAELGGAVLTSIIAVLAPFLVIILLALFVLFFSRKFVNRSRKSPSAA
jgi:hypothetical protein